MKKVLFYFFSIEKGKKFGKWRKRKHSPPLIFLFFFADFLFLLDVEIELG
jgi:hypothetical protein